MTNLTATWGIGTHDLTDGPVTRLVWADGRVEYLPGTVEQVINDVADFFDSNEAEKFTARLATSEERATAIQTDEDDDDDSYEVFEEDGRFFTRHIARPIHYYV